MYRLQSKTRAKEKTYETLKKSHSIKEWLFSLYDKKEVRCEVFKSY